MNMQTVFGENTLMRDENTQFCTSILQGGTAGDLPSVLDRESHGSYDPEVSRFDRYDAKPFYEL